MNRRCLFLLVGLQLLFVQSYGQVVEWTFDIMDRFETSCETSFNVFDPENNTEAILTYLRGYSEIDDLIAQYNCNGNPVSAHYTNSPLEENDCSFRFQREYVVLLRCEDITTVCTFHENITVLTYDESNEPTVSGSFNTELTGCFKEDLPDELTIDGLRAKGFEIVSSCGKDEQLELSVTTEVWGEPAGCFTIFDRAYTITDKCLALVGRGDLGTIHEYIRLNKKLKLLGSLKGEIFKDNLPAAYRTVSELQNHGVFIDYTCNASNLSLAVSDESTQNGYLVIRHYTVSDPGCPDIETSINQFFMKTRENLEEFTFDWTNESLEGACDGTLTITHPSVYDYDTCASCPIDDLNKWYKVELTNVSENETITHVDPENVFYFENLCAGDYEFKIYPRCNWDDTKYIFSKTFKISTASMDLSVTPGITLYSNNIYGEFYSQLAIDYGDNLYHPYSEYDETVSHFTDEWETPIGKLFTPTIHQFDPYEAYNPYMGGFGAYETMMWHYDLYNEQYSHGLQRMALGKNVTDEITYRIYKKSDEGERGELFKEVTKQLYERPLWCSNDPNEIFGPDGFGDEKFVNASDKMNYTIRFENDPEFATAAAARVKVTCPIHPNAVRNSFRLGNFGFGEYTFEIPPLANNYNQRIDLADSLGVWLDVTAGIDVDADEAFWIFQSIDPATGLAPIDSIGFLPVNDTLIGNGEGYVTFNIMPATGLHTGDTVAEQAQIIFDENEVVPTNTYVNTFDVVAPTSAIVCDTTGAFLTKSLTIGFDALDDTGGSGVKYIELYANIDYAGYQLVSNVFADSVFYYSLTGGTNFEFIGLAIDNVGNREAFKTVAELYYSLGKPPYDITLSNSVFAENDAIGTLIGEFTTFDDQNTDIFTYSLVNSRDNDNNLFRIEDNRLVTDYDFRCRGNYSFTIRVRSTDITNSYLDKDFVLTATPAEKPEPTMIYARLCPGESVMFGGSYLFDEGVFYDTLSTSLGCDSVVCLRISKAVKPITSYYDDAICFGDDYLENGFGLTADSISSLTQGWDMHDNIVLNLEKYTENVDRCMDTARLTLTVHPAYALEENYLVCPTDLPFIYNSLPFSCDTTFQRHYLNRFSCDSTITVNIRLNPDYGTQSNDLTAGWGWYSTYIDQSNGRGLENLENALGENGMLIKSKQQFVQRSGEDWYGNLSEIDNISMYMINVSDHQRVDLTGCYVDSHDVDIPLSPGWNWISYPSAYQVPVSTAMSGLNVTPADGSILKSQNQFAYYYESLGCWYGTLSMMQPGNGYMYMSKNADDIVLTYQHQTRSFGEPLPLPEIYWKSDEHRFAENITFVGMIQLDDRLIYSDTLEVGAFCQAEKRGSGRAIYIESLDSYRIFLNVSGLEGDAITFRLYDHQRGKERRVLTDQRVVFTPNSTFGSMDNPYIFKFDTYYDYLIEAEICQGNYYLENGFRANETGSYFRELTNDNGNDSIVKLQLTVNPSYEYQKEAIALDFPFELDSIVFDGPGDYVLHFVTEYGCDSIVTYKINSYEMQNELIVSPVPANRSDKVTLFYPFSVEQKRGLKVEFYNLNGVLVQSFKPHRFPIELDPIRTTGTYTVVITMGTGEVLTKKIIII